MTYTEAALFFVAVIVVAFIASFLVTWVLLGRAVGRGRWGGSLLDLWRAWRHKPWRDSRA